MQTYGIKDPGLLTAADAQLQPGENLIRILSGGKIREYEAHVPDPGTLKRFFPQAGKTEHPVMVAFDGLLAGARKGPFPYSNVSEVGLPPNGMPGNGFRRAADESGSIAIFPVPQRKGPISGWGRVLKFVDEKRDIQLVKDIMADLPRRAPVEMAPVQTAETLPLARVHLAGMSAGGNFVRTLISEGTLPVDTVKSALMVSAPRYSSQGPIQAGIDIMITRGQPRSIAGLRRLASMGVEGISSKLLDSFPAVLGRGDSLVRYEGGPGIEGKIATKFFKQNEPIAESKPYLLFHDATAANGIDSTAVVPDASNPFFIRRSAQSAEGTKIDETLLAQPFDGHNFARRPVVAADGKAVSSRYKISDLHGPVIPASQFSTIDRWLEFTGLAKAPEAVNGLEHK